MAGRWALAAVLALGLSACGQGAGLDRLAAGEHGRVAEVRSGDVLVLDSGLVVRLAGLEVPRFGDPGADEAKAALARLVEGRAVQLYYGGARRDPFGRALAQARLEGGGWVQGALLEAGEAQVRTYADNRAMARPMLDDEARARIAHRGLWRPGGAFKVLLPQEVAPGDSGFVIVEGPVVRVAEAADGDVLEFTRAPDGFAAQVPPAARPDLAAGGLAPQSLQGRMLRVRGTIDSEGLMRIDHPGQIEVVDAK